MASPSDEKDPARGERIRASRTALNLRQVDLASAVGVNERSIGTWEGGGPLRQGYVLVLAQTLETTPTYLLTGEDADDGQAPSGDVTGTIVRVEKKLREHNQWAVAMHKQTQTQAAAMRGDLASVHAELVAARQERAAITAALEAVLLELTALRQAQEAPSQLDDSARRVPGTVSTFPVANA